MYSHLRYRDYVDITKLHIWEVVYTGSIDGRSRQAPWVNGISSLFLIGKVRVSQHRYKSTLPWDIQSRLVWYLRQEYRLARDATLGLRYQDVRDQRPICQDADITTSGSLQVLCTPGTQPFAQEQRVSDFSWKLPGTASRCGMDHGLFLPHCLDGGSQRVIFNCPSALPFIRLLQIWHANSLFPSCQVVSEAWYEYYRVIYR